MKSRLSSTLLAATILGGGLALTACVLSVSTPPAATHTPAAGQAVTAAPQTAEAEAAQDLPETTIPGGPSPQPPAEGTPAAFLPLIKDPGEIEASDLQNLGIAGVQEVENPEYAAQLGSPTYLPNFAHSELGCNWLGVAGQVFNLEQQAVKNLIVEVGGRLPDAELPALALTGLAPSYGPGGYEVALSNSPAASRNVVWVQVFDLSGRPLSEMFYFDTQAGCGRNLILINFAQVQSKQILYLPSLLKDQVPAR